MAAAAHEEGIWILLRALMLGLVILAVTRIAAATSSWNQHDFRLRSWGVAEGLPGNHVAAIAEDADGFLWLATMTGVVRFDGFDFQNFDARGGQLPTSRFTAIDIGPSGRIWVGSEQGDLIVRESGRFDVVAAPIYPGIRVGSVAEAVDGSVWFTQGVSPFAKTGVMLFHWVDGSVEPAAELEAKVRAYPIEREWDGLNHPGGPLTLESRFPQLALVRDSAGRVWGRAWRGSSLRLDDALNDPLGAGDASLLMLGSADLMARRVKDIIELVPAEGGAPVATFNIESDRLSAWWLQDRRGLHWVSVKDAMEVYAPGNPRPVARWLLQSQVLDVIEDRAGNIWIATATRGLLRVMPNPVRQLGADEGLGRSADIRRLNDGSVVMATQMNDSLREQLESTRFQLLPNGQNPVPYPGGWRLTDRYGTEWRSGGLALPGIRVDGSETRLKRPTDSLIQDPVSADILWGFSEAVFFQIKISAHADPEVLAEWPLGVRAAPVFDADGGLWLGTVKGLYYLKDNQLRHFGTADGLPVDDVRALYRDGDGALWIATYGGGLVHYDGRRFRVIDQSHGLIENAVSGIVPDAHGALWLAGNRGVQRVLMADLQDFVAERVTRIRAELFGADYGMDNPETIGAQSAMDVGDTLYFSTFGGLVAINPQMVAERDQLPPLVHLLDATGEQILAGNPVLTLEQGRRELRLRYTAIHLSAPATLQFRHRLRGLEEDWVDSGGSREAQYSRLQPGQYQFELQARHAGGSWISAASVPTIDVLPLWWETLAAKIGAGLLLLMLLALAWLLANRRIRNRALALEALVGERTADLQIERDQVSRQATRLQELAEGRARFMSGISHELRTPLSLILAPLQDLQEGRHGKLPNTVRQEIERIRRNAQRLLRLVERLLEVARVEANGQTLRCHATDLRASIDSLVEQLQPLTEQTGSSLIAELPEAPVEAWLDPLLIESVLVNLMVNGLKHTAAGTQVTVTLDTLDDGSDHGIVVQVRDNGDGIPADALPHLFERFFRVGGEHASSADGFGLGLPLVREVVERHGGAVEVASSSAGTCFTLKLRSGAAHLSAADLAQGPAPARRQPSFLSTVQTETDAADDQLLSIEVTSDDATPVAETVAEDQPLVLVIDDNAELRRLVRSYLEPTYRVREFDAADSALAELAKLLPDLIVSDVMMPRMDGFEFVKALRANSEISFIPVLLLTAKSGLDYRVEGLEGGADAYLSKPFDRREFQATVQALMAGQQRLRDHYLQQAPATAAPESPPEAIPDHDEPTPLVARLHRVIEAHLADENFDVEALATAMAQERTTLYRLVKSQLGITPSELLRESRLLRARQLLEAGEGGVGEIAYAVGFKNVGHFSTSFRQRFGQSPSQLAAALSKYQQEA